MSPLDQPRTLREEQKAFTRRRLVDAAVEVFAATGYTQATIEDITNAAGASRATFYLHFKSKAEIVKVLLTEELLPHSNEIYEQLHALENPTWAEARALVSDLLDYWDIHRGTIDILIQAHAAEPDEIGPGWGKALLGTSGVLAHYLTHVRQVDDEAAHVRAVLLIGLVDRYTFFARLPGVRLDREIVIDSLTAYWLMSFQQDMLAGSTTPAACVPTRADLGG
jgi:AcrR family transcriptional regulator